MSLFVMTMVISIFYRMFSSAYVQRKNGVSYSRA